MLERKSNKMEYSKFTEYCDKKICLRKTMYYEKTCVKDSKRQDCFKKYLRKLGEAPKVKENPNLEIFDQLWNELSLGTPPQREVSVEFSKRVCSIWKILTSEEQGIVEKEEGFFLQKYIDPAHIVPASKSHEMKSDSGNVTLQGRFFHSRLTDMKHPVTGESITNAQVRLWNMSAKIGKRLQGI